MLYNLFIGFLATFSKGKVYFCVWLVCFGGEGSLENLLFSLSLESRKLGIKGEQNDWAVPRMGVI